MKRIRFGLVAALAVYVWAAESAVMAAESFDPAARVAAVSPFVRHQTVAIVRLDLGRIDVQATADRLGELAGPGGQGHIREASGHLQRAARGLQDAGSRDLYILVDLADLPKDGPVVVAVVPAGASTAKVAEAMRAAGLEGVQPMDKAVLAGSANVIRRLRATKPANRPELAQAFAAAGDTAAQLLLLPTDDNRRVLAEMLPQLPAELGGGSGRALADGLLWAAIGIDFPPRPSIHVTVQSKDAEAARGLKSLIAGFYRSLAGSQTARKMVPHIDELTAVATPAVKGDQLHLTLTAEDGGIEKVLAALAAPIQALRQDASRRMCANNLKQLALAMHNYHDVYKHFPAAANYDAGGKPLLSWRVHLLPYLEANDLYKQFRLDEPWDSQHNRKLIEKMPAVFTCPSTALRSEGKTTYLAPVGPDTIFRDKQGMRVRDIMDGTSNTIMLIDAAPQHAVIWTKPADMEVDPDNLLRELVSQHENVFGAALCDGSVRFIPGGIDVNVLRLLFDPDDGQVPPQF